MQRKQIFIVDDNKGLTTTFKHTLESRGHAVHVTNQSLLAVDAIRGLPVQPDIIFLDVLMPSQEGGDVYNQLQADPRLGAIPVVFFTSMVTPKEARNGALNKLGHRYLAKPATLDEVEKVMAEIFSTRDTAAAGGR
jgi:CheY-like chemotaxis protein